MNSSDISEKYSPTGWTIISAEYYGSMRNGTLIDTIGEANLSWDEVVKKYAKKLRGKHLRYIPETKEWTDLDPRTLEAGNWHMFSDIVPTGPYIYIGREQVAANRKQRALERAASWKRPKRIKRYSSLLASIQADIVRLSTECWLWLGSIDQGGYGVLRHEGKTWRAHRLVYTLLAGEIPEGALLRHTCDNRMCANPLHLIPGTVYNNNEDANQRGKGLHSPKRKGELGNNIYWEGRKIPLDEIHDIRLSYFLGEYTINGLAKEHDLSRATVARIVNFRTPVSWD